MKLFRTLLALCGALLVVPAAASAQLQVAPPGGDNYLQPIFLADETNPLPLSPGVVGFDADTTNYTTQDNDPIFEGGGEYNACGPAANPSVYGKTVWSVFYADRYGRVDVTAAGFDGVIGLHSFDSPQNPGSTAGVCTDRIAGKIESFPRDNLPTVKKNSWYAVQVGGFRNPADGSIAGGPMEVAVELLPPEQVLGDGGLTWVPARGGIKAKSVRVDGPTGATATIQCIKKSCGKRQVVRNPKLKDVFARPLSRVNPAKGADSDEKYVPKKEARIRAATKTVFKGRTIKNGSRLLVIISAPDQIGQAFFWDVKKNAAGAKNIGCTEPGSSRVLKLGSCDGR